MSFLCVAPLAEYEAMHWATEAEAYEMHVLYVRACPICLADIHKDFVRVMTMFCTTVMLVLQFNVSMHQHSAICIAKTLSVIREMPDRSMAWGRWITPRQAKAVRKD
eukprot:scaffold447153_cov19-Prasinocladus_malaysianus.AAC.2